jgi:Flp pilus assembly protein TadG
MEKLIKKYEKKGGQVLVIVALMLVVLLSFSTLIIDGGSKSLTRRQLQNAADAAALAGARDLPDDTAKAITDAQAYALANGKSTDNVTVTLSNDNMSIKVEISRTSPSYLAQIFNQNTSIVKADASASAAAVAASVPWIVPFVIAKPDKFNFDKVYVLRMYGAGDKTDYPGNGFPTSSDSYLQTNSGYSRSGNKYAYPYSYRTDPFFKDYPLGTTTTTDVYTITNINGAPMFRSLPIYFGSQPIITVPSGTVVEYNYSKSSNYIDYFNVSYTKNSTDYTGFVLASSVTKTTGSTTTESTIYPYEFDYMNVNITPTSGQPDYEEWLKNGYHKTFTIGEKMYYKAPSTGNKAAVDVFEDRLSTSRDPNTDYTQAKVGESRVILIPVVEEMLSRDTADNTPMTIIGFVGFFIQEVHHGKGTGDWCAPDNYKYGVDATYGYGECYWFEGRFLNNLSIGTGSVTFDPNADFGLRVVTLTE